MDPIRTFQPTFRPYSQLAPADNTRVAYRPPVRREPDRPATDLSSHLGHDDYYLERKKDFEKRHPGLKAPDYYQNYGDKYLHRFKYELRPELSPEGQKWVDHTLVGLQRKIESERRRDPVAFDRLERNPDAFRKFCFDSHPSAYLEGGLNTLSVKEQAMIAATPDVGDLLSPSGLEQAVGTGGRLLGDYIQHPDRFVIPNLREVQRVVHPSPQTPASKSTRGGASQPLGFPKPYPYPSPAFPPMSPTTPPWSQWSPMTATNPSLAKYWP